MSEAPSIEAIKADMRQLALPASLEFNGVDLAPGLVAFASGLVANLTPGYLPVAPGFGLAVSPIVPFGELMRLDWDDPTALLGFGAAVGGGDLKYVCNVVRKFRFLLRSRHIGEYARPPFTSLEAMRAYGVETRNVVESSNPDGSISWGDFPYAGAGYHTNGEHEFLIGVSVWPQRKDNTVQNALGGRLIEQIDLMTNPD